MNAILEIAKRAREASHVLAALSGPTRRAALEAVAAALEREDSRIAEANDNDCERARNDRLAEPLLKRLVFDEEKRVQATKGVRAVATLPDPVGRILERRELDAGLVLTRVTTPIGVIAMIFESRPDALVQIASLALKSGNAVVLKGGSEARESNSVLAWIIHNAGVSAGAPTGWVQLIETREDVGALLQHSSLIDLVIPRGSNAFVRYIMDNTRIPVLGHADGICHVYLDCNANEAMAVALTVDSKTQYVAVCNAAETLLVHCDAAQRLLPAVARALREHGVVMRGCRRTCAIVPGTEAADETDWGTEFLDLVISVRVVDSLDEAITHINTWGSGHTDAIVTDEESAAREFLNRVDSASVLWNASTRFADGYRYGLGAEVGISTSRIHARGPVGVDGLLSSKWIVIGEGHVVDDYVRGRRRFTHREIATDKDRDAKF